MTNLERYVLGVPAEILFQHFYCHGCDNCPAQQFCSVQPDGTCCRENFLAWAECAPLPDNKALTVEELRGRTKPVWCDVPDCSWIPEGGYYCLCEKGMITAPSKITLSAEECIKNGWVLLDRPPEKGE